MSEKSPYQIIKHRRVTEKAKMLESLSKKENNPSLKAYTQNKYVFVVDKEANKKQIADSVEAIFADKKIKVVSVNTILIKPKPRTVRGRPGKTGYLKKAIVTLAEGHRIDEQV